MDREMFKSRLKQYKKAREENPELKYWEWKKLPKYDGGTEKVTLKEKEDAFWRGDAQKMAELVEREGDKLTYVTPESDLDEVVVTAKDSKKEKQLEKDYNNILDLGITAAGFVPGLGEVADAVDVVNQLRQGNYTDAALAGLGFVVPFIPGSSLRKIKNSVLDYVGDKTGYFFHVPQKENEIYRQVTQSAIDDAESSGVIRSNPKSEQFGRPIHWAGASFQKGRLYNPRDKVSNAVIVGNVDNIEVVSRPGHMHYDEFDIASARNGFGEYTGEEVTPVFNNRIDAAPITDFYYYQKGNKGLSKYFWKKKKFKLDNVDISNMDDSVLDRLYEETIKTADTKNTQRLRDLHFIKAFPNTVAQYDGLPQTWYHGAPYGNFNKFDSSKFSSTIGGASAIGDKGIFFTTDLPSAQRYAKSSDFIDVKKLFDSGKGRGVLDVLDKTDQGVYQVYLNAVNPKIVDFHGAPWSKAPVDVPSNYSVIEYIDDFDGIETPYKTFDDAKEAYLSFGYGKGHEPDALFSQFFDSDRKREIIRFTGAPLYRKVKLVETRVPNTTNGVVNWAIREGNDSALMTNVIDSNGGGINNEGYAIDDLVVLKSNQVKLRDSVTYDDDGNIIKLSKRDDPNTDDIRFAGGGEVPDEGGYTESYWSRKNREAVHKSLDPTMRFSPETLLFGNNATGEEDQYWRAYLGLENSVPTMNKNAYTEWDKKVEAEKAKNKENLSDFYGTTPNMDLSLQAVADTLSLGKMSREYDKYSKEYRDLPSKRSIDALYQQAKRVMDNPGKWQQMYSDDHIIKSTPFEDDGEVNPLGMLAHYGMKWVPEENSLYVHDTYDFPWLARLAGKIKERPNEMKIRSKISFNPKKGSRLLRSAKNYNDTYK